MKVKGQPSLIMGDQVSVCANRAFFFFVFSPPNSVETKLLPPPSPTGSLEAIPMVELMNKSNKITWQIKCNTCLSIYLYYYYCYLDYQPKLVEQNAINLQAPAGKV